MRYLVLACDYDGTIATDGLVTDSTIAAFERLRASGRKLLLVTGRELDDLKRVMPRLDLFDRVLAENGALLYRPQTQDEQPLGERPPDEFVRALLPLINTAIVVGKTPLQTLAPLGVTAPKHEEPLPSGTALLWQRHSDALQRFEVAPPNVERQRHSRKYATGTMTAGDEFVFRGPEGKLSLRATNLVLFTQMAEGVDDDTWLFHLRQGDYSTWLRDKVKDADLAHEAAQAEREARDDAQESRRRIREAIERRYTLPA